MDKYIPGVSQLRNYLLYYITKFQHRKGAKIGSAWKTEELLGGLFFVWFLFDLTGQIDNENGEKYGLHFQSTKNHKTGTDNIRQLQ